MNVLKPTPFFPNVWYGPMKQGYRARNAFVEISDGGHFENLGVYELIRRKTDLIIAFDGEADPETGLAALVSLSRRIEEDFEATITQPISLDDIVPFGSVSSRFPGDAKFSKLPCAKLIIKHSNSSQTTTLIYIKALLTDDTPFFARGYRAKHPDFPHESTANQFYSPEQFDAYRELGQACTAKALNYFNTEIQAILKART